MASPGCDCQLPETTPMSGCEDIRARFPDLLGGAAPSEEGGAVEEHLARCPDCSRELRALEAAWRTLPPGLELRAPTEARRIVVEYARRAVDAHAREPSTFYRRLGVGVRGLAGPVALGAGAALLVVSLLHLRGAAVELPPVGTAAVSLAFAAILAAAAGGVLQSGASREVRGIFSGALGSLGGYVVLTLLSPISETVEFCRVTVLGGPELGLTQLCLVYLGVAALYAGAPMAVGAYLQPEGVRRWSTGALQGAVFTLLAAPVVVLQFGTAEWMITGTGLLGLALGAVAGGAAGSWVRGRRVLQHG